MDSTIFFNTYANSYMYDYNLGSYTICHPLLKYFYYLDSKKQPSLTKEQIISRALKEVQDFNEVEVEYYHKKYLHLKNCGYFSSINKNKELKITSKIIEKAFYNAKHIVFEVTDACNLRCKYCGYGEFYGRHVDRYDKFMSFETIKNFIDYFFPIWNSNKNDSSVKPVSIGFYGGEPLLNIEAIKKTVGYLNSLPDSTRKFHYHMTTNAVLIDKYIDFFIDNRFSLLISLDGSEYNHSYRAFHNGKNSFNKVLSNIKTIKQKNPSFFKNNVNFNSVLHDRNSVDSITEFIKFQFDKYPRINPLNDTGIINEKREEFNNMFNNLLTSIESSINKEHLVLDLFSDDPRVRSLLRFLYWFGSNQFDNYPNLFVNQTKDKPISTGTCLPFAKKLFLTVNNKIMACERISQDFILGEIVNNKIKIDFQNIANKYNKYFDKIYSQCKNCYRSGRCDQCIFHLDGLDRLNKNIRCVGFQSKTGLTTTMKRNIQLLEEHPILHSRIIKELNYV